MSLRLLRASSGTRPARRQSRSLHQRLASNCWPALTIPLRLCRLPGKSAPPALTATGPPIRPVPPRMLLTRTGPGPVAEPLPLVTKSVPSLMRAPPVKLLDIARVKLPSPTLLKDPPVPPAAPPSAMNPENTVDIPLLPTARLFLPRNTCPPSPIEVPPVREPIVTPGRA
jgi:hypothetical protein